MHNIYTKYLITLKYNIQIGFRLNGVVVVCNEADEYNIDCVGFAEDEENKPDKSMLVKFEAFVNSESIY